MPSIARPSVASLFLLMVKDGRPTGNVATGFVVERGSRRFLITNRHVVLGESDTRPDSIEITHNRAGQLGQHERRIESLYDGAGRPRWLEHPAQQPSLEVDVVALPLVEVAGIETFPYDPWSPGPGLTARVAEPLSIVGFPFGVTGGVGDDQTFGVWVRGFVASEPEVDWQGLPVFLIDGRTRRGQSGSPVIAYASGGVVPTADGGTAVFAGPVEQFFGVYAGRITEESDLGVVWKASVVREVVDQGHRGTVP